MSGADEERRKRLAEALRANLRRRKAQAREKLPSTSHRPAAGGGLLLPETGEGN
jgi:hypothetical protein